MGSRSDDDSFIVLGSSRGTSLDLDTSDRNSPWRKTEIDDAMLDLSDDAYLALKARYQPGKKPSQPSMMAASNTVTDRKTLDELQREFGQLFDENIILKETLKQNNAAMKQQYSLLASCHEDIFLTHQTNKEKFRETRDLVMQLRQENKQLKRDIIRLAESIHSQDETGEGSNKENGEMEPSARLNVFEIISMKQSLEKSRQSEATKEEDSHIGEAERQMRRYHSEETFSDRLFEDPKEASNVAEKASNVAEKALNGEKEAFEEGNVPEVSVNVFTSRRTSIASSAIEFVTSPEDDVIDKLSCQLNLVEKQRREVIVTNEKLQWQKESLERMLDASAKEIDELKSKLTVCELEHKPAANEYTQDDLIVELEEKINNLEASLSAAYNTIKENETEKNDLEKRAFDLSNRMQSYIDLNEELQNKIRDLTSTVFVPVVQDMNSSAHTPEARNFIDNVKVYEDTLNGIASLFNKLLNNPFDCIVHAQKIVECLEDYDLDVQSNRVHVQQGLAEIKTQLEIQNGFTFNNVLETRTAVRRFEGIIADYNRLVNQMIGQGSSSDTSMVVERQLTAALAARGKEIEALKAEIRHNKAWKEEVALLQEQLDCYQNDFHVEREARTLLASERDNLLADLRTTQKRNQELLMQMEQVKELTPAVYEFATKKPVGAIARPQASTSQLNRTTGNRNSTMKYSCPKCQLFSSDQYNAMEDHFDVCLED